MRKLTIAILALAPLALQAQAIRPAQPQNLMLAAAIAPAAPAAGALLNPVRISTGVIAPVVVHAVEGDSWMLTSYFVGEKTVTLELTVTAKGLPTNVKVLRSVSPDVDRYALAALQQYRFRPATLDGAPVAVDMVMNVKVPAHMPVN